MKRPNPEGYNSHTTTTCCHTSFTSHCLRLCSPHYSKRSRMAAANMPTFNKKPDRDSFFFFSFVVLQFILPEAPQPYGLLYYPPYWTFQLSPPVPRCHDPLSREIWSCKPVNLDVSKLSPLVVFERYPSSQRWNYVGERNSR
jgi:hypothetical protein